MIRKPTREQIEQLRTANPKGAPRYDYREMELVVERQAESQGDGGEEAETIAVAISSEKPVLRYDWWEDEVYYEVLEHSPRSIDLSYAGDGLPFIAGHRAWDADSQHGIVENVRVEKKVLRGDIRMSRAARSQEIKNDLVDGIRKKVSVGYILGDEYTQSKPDKDGVPTRTYTSWMPVEVSTVPVPADYDVGIGRAKSAAGQAALARFLELHPAARSSQTSTEASPAKEKTVETTTSPAPGGANPSVQVTERDINERAAKRIGDITALGNTHKVEPEKVQKWIAEGASVDAVRAELNDILAKRLADVGTVRQSRGVEVSDKELKRFSYARALLQDGALEKELGAKIDIAFEREIVEEARKRTPMTAGQGGIFVPYVTSPSTQAQRALREEMEQELAALAAKMGKRVIDSATATTGGPFKFTQPGDFIDLLRVRTSVMRAGATLLTGLTGPVTFPKQSGAGTATWRAENPGSDLSRADLTVSTVSLAFKTVQAAMAVSRQALFSAASGNYDLEAIIRNDLAKIIALAIDLGGLNGSGASNQPLGVLQDTNVGAATALGANGGTMAWANWVELETVVGDQNADIGRMAYITNTKQRSIGKRTAVLAQTASGIPIWSGGMYQPGLMDPGATLPNDGQVNGYPALVSNQVPSNLTKGTATNCSAVVFGVWEHLLIGQFGAGFEVLVDPYTLKLQNCVDLTAWNFVDVANRYAKAFSTIKDALP